MDHPTRDDSFAQLPYWLALAAWVLLSLAAEYLRPGELLEFGLVGVAAVGAWALVRRLDSGRLRLLAALLFLLPLLNTWPARALFAQVERLGSASYLLAPGSLLALLVVAVAPLSRAPRPSRPAVLFAGLLAAAVVASTLASEAQAAAAASAWVALLVPAALGLAVGAAAKDVRAGWALVGVPAAAALVPAAMGLVAYVLVYGVPLSIDDLVEGKQLLARTGLVQEVTFGNVAHLAAFALLIGPPAAAAAFSRSLPAALRACAAAAAALLACALLLSFSRAGFLTAAVVCGVAAALAGLQARRSRRTAHVAAAVALAVAAPLVASLAWAPFGTGPDQRPGAVDVPRGLGEDASASVRREAIRRGLSIFDENRLGVGAGRYASYDLEHTSPHSLGVLMLAETGALGGAALVVLLLLLLASLRRFAGGLADDEWLLRLGCALGAGGFLLYGLAAGAPLAIGPVNVWALLLALTLGVQLSELRR